MLSSPSSFSSQAAQNRPSGCLRRFLLPPISVILISIGLAVLLSQINVDLVETAPLTSENSSSTENQIASLFSPEVLAWQENILDWSDKYQLDPNLVATVMQIESCGYSRAESSVGAMGLFQVMPYHFKEGEDPFKPGINARRGLSYLRQALKSGGDVRLALAGYNGGITGAQNPEENWPEETRRYVYWGLKIYKDAEEGKEHSPRLQEWLDSGGSSLCLAASNQQ
ncbi:MAG: transglycosylase SLT domain-containing protein [Anaerolineales bacterium]|nr:transglycosylase SLT domain-containing protein [Anaerolineales bacterium]